MPASIYYIRGNATAALPTNILIVDTETSTQAVDNAELHTMYLAVTWRITVDHRGRIERQAWKVWKDRGKLCTYISSESRSKAPLYVIGSNITFDIFAIDLLSHLTEEEWKLDSLYDKGLVTILIASKGNRKLKICAAQNWLQGGVKDWGKLINLEKMDVDFSTDTPEKVEEYCKRDVEITGKTFLSYLDFLRVHNMGGFALTIAGQSFRCFRHKFMKPRSILHYDQYTYNAFTRAAYYGGRVECGHIGQLEGEFTKLDINSMYPHIMREHLFPGKVKQWVRDISVADLQTKMVGSCAIAEVEVTTDEPAYAVRRDGKLIFPTGSFVTYLCSDSIRYALKHGHITKVRQAMIFNAVKMFDGFVDYFYPLKNKYREENNGVWEKTTKLILNSLYGKFGERRSREISRSEAPGEPVSRIPGLYSRDGLTETVPKFDWRYDQHSGENEEYVRGVTYTVLNTQITEAGEDEGPGSAPAIAAHVTDCARMLLYRYMRHAGLDKVLYCDTDSLILRTSDVHTLEGFIDDTKLGKLKTEGVASTIEIRGAKDYSFGDDLRRKGIRKQAVLVCRRCRSPIDKSARRCSDCGDHISTPAFTQDSFPGFYSLLRRGISGGFPIGTITKSLTAQYTKGVVADTGDVTPIPLNE